MRKLFLILMLISFFSLSAYAVSPKPAPKLCNVLFSDDLVVHAKVHKIKSFKDKDDPEGVAGWIYYLDVIKVYRGKTGKKLVVYSLNDTSRLLLKTGKEYFVFASKNGGRYEAGNYGNGVQGVDGEIYSREMELRIQKLLKEKVSIIEGEVRDKNWKLTSGAVLTIIGNGVSQNVTVDKNGLFSVKVEPGIYKVVIPKNLDVTIYSSNSKIDSLSLVAGQCAQIQLQEQE
jgi:hypothetical protein